MTQTINNVKDVGTVIAKIAAGMLADKTQFLKAIDKEPASSFGQVNGFNVGDTINISKPARFIPTSTADITSGIQEVVEEKTSLALDTRKIVGVNLTSAEIQNTLALKDWTNRILDPAVSSIAQSVEAAFLTNAKNSVYNSVGTPGSTVYDTDTLLAARQKIKEGLAPSDDLYALLGSAAMRSAVNARKGLFQSSEQIKKQYERGYVGISDGFTFLENQLLPTHTNGADVAMAVENTVTTIANGQTTIGVDGVTSGATVTAGSVFTAATPKAIHPITKTAYAYLQQFVASAAVTETSGNSVAIPILPIPYNTTTDPRQNIDAALVDEDALTFMGAASTSYAQSLCFHPSAFRFVSVPLMKPDGAHMIGQETVDGMTIRVWMDSNILTDKMVMRLDFLGGFKTVRPEWACRIWS